MIVLKFTAIIDSHAYDQNYLCERYAMINRKSYFIISEYTDAIDPSDAASVVCDNLMDGYSGRRNCWMTFQCSTSWASKAIYILLPARCRSLSVQIFVAQVLILAASLACATTPNAKSQAAVYLVMLDDLGCEYCELWQREVGVIYHKTQQGRFAPLRRYRHGAVPYRKFDNVHYSPTFIVVRGEKEVGRIVGYPGEDFFWAMLDKILAGIGFMMKPSTGVVSPS